MFNSYKTRIVYTMNAQKIIRLHSVDSTSNYVAKLIRAEQIANHTVILADNQTNGRGQRANQWNSAPGMNLTFSMYSEFSDLSVSRLQFLNQIISIAIFEMLKSFGIDAKIKWPNDILVGKRKIAGVLIENQLSGSKVKHAVLGIGLNVNENFSEQSAAVSMFSASGQNFITDQVLESLLFRIHHWLDILQKNDDDLILKTYLSNLWLYKQESRFSDTQNEFKGIIQGIDKDGKLLLENLDNNETRAYDLKEIIFLER